MNLYRAFLEAEEALALALEERQWAGVEAALGLLHGLPLPQEGDGGDWFLLLALHERNRENLARWMEEVKKDLHDGAIPLPPPPPPPRWLDRRG
ncbi:MAG: hypothetical protein QJR00_02225 [Bacillota bacterium]|nr:hypothetical protein [Bacillota bacterium]